MPTEAVPPSLVVSGLEAAYLAVPVIRDVTFAVAPGEVLAILGPNGAGKTTTLHALGGLLVPRQGTVSLDGIDITRSSAASRARRGIGYVLQGGRVFGEMTVAENLLLGAARARPSSDAFDEAAELFSFLGERRSQLAATLSGGEQQMLAVARALVGRPRVLLLDEPSWGLGPAVIARIGAAIDQLRSGGRAIVLVEQNLGLARDVADRYVMLIGGRATAAGAMADLDVEEAVSRYLG